MSVDGGSEFDLDEFRVSSSEVREPAIFPVSVLLSRTFLEKPFSDINGTLIKIKELLIKRYSFGKRHQSEPFKEGFLNFNVKQETLEFYYAQETPLKVDFVPERDNPEIITEHIRAVNPTYKVKIRLTLSKQNAEVILFGGSEILVLKVTGLVNESIRAVAEGGHDTFDHRITKEEMLKILEAFQSDVEYIYVDPGQNEKLRKYIKEKRLGEEVLVPAYDVHTRFRGYKVVSSPLVQQIIKETGVYLKEIEGRIDYAAGIGVTSRVSSSGRILFYIPENIVGAEEDVYDIAYNLYKKVVAKRVSNKRQPTIETYFNGVKP